ncbi:MAG: hypothetical protein K940chlam7_00196 [Chlamydiae bacterium]|nr:hypothetical protein [Chlamydiota bacterium]
MFKRDVQKELQNSAKNFPVVTVTGPRQSGKTTLVRSTFAKKPYVNLEDLDTRELAESDPRGFLEEYPEGAILDEVQRVPSILSYIQVIVDEKKQKGQFILTGSHQVELHEAISQSLAGRTDLLSLFPMTINELSQAGFDMTVDEYLLNGFYPQIYQETLNPTKVYRAYVKTYLERDVRRLINIKNLNLFQRFIKLCAGRVGQLLNMSSLANEVGVSSHTIEEWTSVLQASYLVILLQPYFENFGKRVIKSTKLYFTDVGLLSYLLGIENVKQMSRDPLRGHLVENLVMMELFKARSNQGLEPQLYFYRDSQKNEVDVIFQRGHELIPIEIKSAKTFNREFLKNLHFFQKIAEGRSPQGFVIYCGEKEQVLHLNRLINFKNSYQSLQI